METVAAMPREVREVEGRAARSVRVWCVVPWHSRAAEAEALLGDLTRLELEGELGSGERVGLSVQVMVVDNASAESLALPDQVQSRAAGDAGMTFTCVRLEENRGGSGGFNAGMARALVESGEDGEGYVWLLDSDARVTRGALIELVRVLEARRGLGVAGSALADPETGRVFEVGGRVDRRTGALRAACPGTAGTGGPGGAAAVVECDYVASCSALVRMASIRACGLMPDLFLHADDVAWMIRMRRLTGKGVAAVGGSVVYHPRFDRFALRGRYYAARNGFAPLRELGLGRRAAFSRALREVARGVQQELLGRSDLARLHVQGLRDAANGVTGAGRGLEMEVAGFRPLCDLGATLKPLLCRSGSWRVVVESARRLGLSEGEHAELCAELQRAGVHISDPRSAAGRVWRVRRAGRGGAGLVRSAGLVLVARGVRGGGHEPGFVVSTGAARSVAWRAFRTGVSGMREACRVARFHGWRREAPVAESRAEGVKRERTGAGALSLSVVIVSYNRWGALRGTLTRLASMMGCSERPAEVIVVDNASADGSAERVALEFHDVKLVRMPANVGVSAFNRGVDAATGDVVLVLDDDSWPDVGAVEKALSLLEGRPDIGAVVLHPRHPLNARSEWRHAAFAEAGRDDWPVMGCGNLVRREAWRAAGGYEERFFLYRNDVDLALKLLEAGWGVHFNPALTVWHDSPAAARKSERWHRMATRNWIWLAKRHGRGLGLGGVLGCVIGWMWAHRLAGGNLSRQWATACGMVAGVWGRAPAVGGTTDDAVRGVYFARLVRLLMGMRHR